MAEPGCDAVAAAHRALHVAGERLGVLAGEAQAPGARRSTGQNGAICPGWNTAYPPPVKGSFSQATVAARPVRSGLPSGYTSSNWRRTEAMRAASLCADAVTAAGPVMKALSRPGVPG